MTVQSCVRTVTCLAHAGTGQAGRRHRRTCMPTMIDYHGTGPEPSLYSSCSNFWWADAFSLPSQSQLKTQSHDATPRTQHDTISHQCQPATSAPLTGCTKLYTVPACPAPPGQSPQLEPSVPSSIMRPNSLSVRLLPSQPAGLPVSRHGLSTSSSAGLNLQQGHMRGTAMVITDDRIGYSRQR